MILEVIVSIPQTLKGSAVFSNALLSLITIDAYNTLLWFKGEGLLMTSPLMPLFWYLLQATLTRY